MQTVPTADAIRQEAADIEAMSRHIQAVVDRLMRREVERGAALYVRGRDLGALIRDWHTLSDAKIIEALERMIHSESARLIAGFWAADLNRLIALKQALCAERQRA